MCQFQTSETRLPGLNVDIWVHFSGILESGACPETGPYFGTEFGAAYTNSNQAGLQFADPLFGLAVDVFAISGGRRVDLVELVGDACRPGEAGFEDQPRRDECPILLPE